MGRMKTYITSLCVSCLLPLIMPNMARLMPQIKMAREATIAAVTKTTPTPMPTATPTPSPSPTPTPKPTTPPKKTVVLPENTISVPFIQQNPEFPTGCESAATTMALNYYGFDVTLETFIDEYLPTVDSYNTYYKKMKGTGLVFDEYFVGDPRTDDGTLCYESVIKTAVDAYFADINETGYECRNMHGMEFDDVLATVEDGTPVVVWITMYLNKPRTFTLYGVTCYSPSHTVIVTGFDKETNAIVVNDSLSKKASTQYKLDAFEKIYNAVGKRAVVISETQN